jgi:hypothetical protein
MVIVKACFPWLKKPNPNDSLKPPFPLCQHRSPRVRIFELANTKDFS